MILSAICSERFTPTGVGKTAPVAECIGPMEVHPHGCGEDGVMGRCIVGSPPRVWGRRLCLCQRLCQRRFTPTGVGKTRCRLPNTGHAAVHPHGCGEDIAGCCTRWTPTGSPPRVWGRLASQTTLGNLAWFTPTGVGKTGLHVRLCCRSAVHPHGCGEDSNITANEDLAFGSPPRVWGRL